MPIFLSAGFWSSKRARIRARARVICHCIHYAKVNNDSFFVAFFSPSCVILYIFDLFTDLKAMATMEVQRNQHVAAAFNRRWVTASVTTGDNFLYENIQLTRMSSVLLVLCRCVLILLWCPSMPLSLSSMLSFSEIQSNVDGSRGSNRKRMKTIHGAASKRAETLRWAHFDIAECTPWNRRCV